MEIMSKFPVTMRMQQILLHIACEIMVTYFNLTELPELGLKLEQKGSPMSKIGS